MRTLRRDVLLKGLLVAMISNTLFLPRALARSFLSQDQLRVLLSQLKGRKLGVRNQAAQRLYLLQDPKGNAEVLALASHRDQKLRARGVWALAIVRPLGSKALLLKRAHDPAPRVRQAAILAIATLRLPGATKLLRRALKDPKKEVRRAVLRALPHLGRDALAILRDVARGRSLDLRLLALRGLGSLGGSRAQKLLRSIARSARGMTRLLAAEELLRLGDVVGSRLLIHFVLHSPHRGLRLQAIATLGRDKSCHGEKALRRLLRARNTHLRAAAMRALTQRSTLSHPSACSEGAKERHR
ncbi:MAG: HEAT repeat domain-containing protein [Deltaproteobacteria bacterium]|nr:HEAT repeat domain-containing protein [Deltaproteobacteria bacterium]